MNFNLDKIKKNTQEKYKNKNDDLFKDKNEHYYRFLRLPKPSDQKYEETRQMRARQLIHNSRIDTSPKIFFKKMKIEILLLVSGIAFACALPFYSEHLRAKFREPDEINIEDIRNRKKFDPTDHSIRKEKKNFEEKLKKNFTKDEEHTRIREDIKKTYKELYNEDFKI